MQSESEDTMRSAILDQLLGQLLGRVDSNARPSLNALNLALRDIDAMKLSFKLNGYMLARALAEALPPVKGQGPLTIDIRSKPSTQADLQSTWAAHWCDQLKVPVTFHRKMWEFIYVAQVLWQHGQLQPGRRGVGFGCGTEPLPSLFASYGVDVLVTDLAAEDQQGTGWTATNQHTHSLNAVFQSHLVDRSLFDKHVGLRYVDMRAIPSDLTDHDFCWSICALEHLGSIAEGLRFIEESLKTLKPGGTAVHTTELNYLSENDTVDNWPTVLFLRKHFVALAERLTALGHEVAPLDFDVGRDPLDLFVDIPPYAHDWSEYQQKIWPNGNHLKLSIDGFPATCFGITIRKRKD
jgi:SAM-dependent methyltransferase